MPKCEPIVHVNIDSTPVAVSASLKRVFLQLKNIPLPDDVLSSAEIVLAEVLNNIVEHAYQFQPGQNMELWIEQASDRLSFKVRDSGQPLPDMALPEGAAAEISAQTCDLPEGGFGWFLIKSLASDISYIRSEDQNVIRFAIGGYKSHLLAVMRIPSP